MNRRRFIAATGVSSLAGCTGLNSSDDSNEVQDSDGDGMIDSEDYAPDDPDVQEKPGSNTDTRTPIATPSPTQTASPTATPTDSPTPMPTPTPLPDADNDGTRDSLDEFPEDEKLTRRTQSESDTRKIEEDEHRWYKFKLNETGALGHSFVVREGPAIDVIVLEESEYSEYKNGDRYLYKTGVSMMDDTGGDTSAYLDAGTYRIIYDNTSAGEAEPPSNGVNDVVTVEFEFGVAE